MPSSQADMPSALMARRCCFRYHNEGDVIKRTGVDIDGELLSLSKASDITPPTCFEDTDGSSRYGACCSLLLLTCALLMTSSRAKACVASALTLLEPQ